MGEALEYTCAIWPLAAIVVVLGWFMAREMQTIEKETLAAPAGSEKVNACAAFYTELRQFSGLDYSQDEAYCLYWRMVASPELSEPRTIAEVDTEEIVVVEPEEKRGEM